MAALAQFADPTVDQAGWEAAVASLGLREVYMAYYNEAGISPGAQSFVLASTLFGFRFC